MQRGASAEEETEDGARILGGGDFNAGSAQLELEGAAQQLLDCLDGQLDSLTRRRQQSKFKTTTLDRRGSSEFSGGNFILASNYCKPLRGEEENSSRTAQLNEYLRAGLKPKSGDCACHFQAAQFHPSTRGSHGRCQSDPVKRPSHGLLIAGSKEDWRATGGCEGERASGAPATSEGHLKAAAEFYDNNNNKWATFCELQPSAASKSAPGDNTTDYDDDDDETGESEGGSALAGLHDADFEDFEPKQEAVAACQCQFPPPSPRLTDSPLSLDCDASRQASLNSPPKQQTFLRGAPERSYLRRGKPRRRRDKLIRETNDDDDESITTSSSSLHCVIAADEDNNDNSDNNDSRGVFDVEQSLEDVEAALDNYNNTTRRGAKRKRKRRLGPSASQALSSEEEDWLLSGPVGRKRKRPLVAVQRMKAARDIAKLSIPSLSSLQHLPGHLAPPLKTANTQTDKPNENHSNRNSRLATRRARRMAPAVGGGAGNNGGHEEPATGATRLSGAESRETIYQPCLLHRLCLCNCASQNPQTDDSRTKDKDKVGGGGGAQSGLAGSGEDDGMIEKQSPSFINILKASSGERVEADSSCGRRVTSNDDDCDSVNGSSDGLSSSAKSASKRRQHHKTSCEEEEEDELSRRPSSVCSLDDSAGGARKTKKPPSSLRRLLSPTRLLAFSSTTAPTQQQTTSSNTNLAHYHDANLDKRRISPPYLDSSASASFFKRSFVNRFSGGSPKKIKKRPEEATASDSDTRTKACANSSLDSTGKSPSSTASQQSLYSLRSLDQDIELPHYLLAHSPPSPSLGQPVSLGPEIVLSRVEWPRHQHHHQKQHMGGSRNNSSNLELADEDYYARNLTRYGSDIGQDYSTTDCASGSERALSLPSSPIDRARYQQQQRSRSPRLSQSPVPFQSPASQSTKIEDGLKVCSAEHFEKHIGNIRGGQLEAQKKLFTAWINHFCPHLIQQDLIEELRDGVKLIGLLAALTRDKRLVGQYEKFKRDKQSLINRLVVTPSSKLRHLSNVSTAIDYLRKEGGMKLINLNPMDVVQGKPNVILGLCWNIILHFQLEQNFLRHLELDSSSLATSRSSSIHAASLESHLLNPSTSTSRLSPSSTNEDGALLKKRSGAIKGLLEEYSFSDLVAARRRLLDHINKRFNLKLTHLTSSLLDGDALLVVVKQLMSPEDLAKLDLSWTAKSNDEKLDTCFELAQTYLGVPRLFSALDLRQQAISENATKPLLIYLSMLLNAPEPPDARENLKPAQSHQIDQPNAEADSTTVDEGLLREYLSEVDQPNSFSLDKLQSTLARIKELNELLADYGSHKSLDLVADFERVKEQAARVEALISWINEADNLFDRTQKASLDLIESIKEYRQFFSPANLPQVGQAPLCSTLERQYRECLNTAKQRVLLMEQTLKNRSDYERAKRSLMDWLAAAESKLGAALQPTPAIPEGHPYNPLEHHKACLEDLIEYFELEPMECILTTSDLYNLQQQQQNCDDEPISSNFGSLLSLASNSSRLSSCQQLQSSRKAAYYALFDEFELKCRLLAAQLEPEQREALVVGVREFRHRLRYITEQRVPQVVSELKFNILRTEMFIEDSAGDEPHLTVPTPSTEEVKDDDDDNELQISDCLEEEEEEEAGKEEVEPHIQPVEERRRKMATAEAPAKSVGHDNLPANDSSSSSKSDDEDSKQRPLVSWSMLSWLFMGNDYSEKAGINVVVKQGGGRSTPKKNQRLAKGQKARALKTPVKSAAKSKQNKASQDGEEPNNIPFARLFWNKILRATKASWSLNIVLLICLTGICVGPLILNRSACCELSQPHIPTDEFGLHEKPT